MLGFVLFSQVIEDDLHSKVDLLRTESETLKEKMQNKDSVVTALSDEKAKLLTAVETLEGKLGESAQTVTELQQKCDLMSEKLESLRVEKGALEQEKDVSVLQKTQEKLNLENFAKKMQELQEKLENEKKDKKELLNAVNEMEELLKQEKKCVEKKSKELNDMETVLKLADSENEESVKEKEAKIVEMTFAYEDLRDKLDKEGKALDEKCKELDEVKKELKQAQERIEELKEEYEGELDRVNFELRDSNNDCVLLRGENEQLKRSSTGSADRTTWNREKKKLLHQLEESKIRFNQAKSSQEKLEKELSAANLKVISLESKGKPAEVDAIKRLQARVSELNQELQKWKAIANHKEKAVAESKEISAKVEEIKRLQARVSELNQELQKWKSIANNKEKLVLGSGGKDAEKQSLQAKVCELQEELEKTKALADEKRKAADKTLTTNLKLVSKIEKLEKQGKQQNAAPTTSESATVVESAPRLTSPPKPSRVNLTQAVSNAGVLSPLAKSLANLDIKSQNTAGATVREDTRRGDQESGMATRRGIPKPSEAMDSKKRAGEQGMLSLSYQGRNEDLPNFSFK